MQHHPHRSAPGHVGPAVQQRSRGLPGLRRGDDPHFRPGAGPVAALGGQVERHIGNRTHVLEQGDRTAHGTSFLQVATTRCSHSAISGYNTSTTITASLATTKGSEPLITSRIWPRLRTPCTTNRLRPTGGVIRAVSSSTIIRIPNHTGSKPMEITTGVMIGTVAIIIDSDSMNMPSTRYRAMISHKIGRAHVCTPVTNA